jgi:trans-2,3-dihydro-3-hydroxyanthranilate isomerase
MDPAPLLAAVGLGTGDLVGPPPRLAGCGISFAFMGVRPDAVARAVPHLDALRKAGAGTGVSINAWDPGNRAAHTRVFCGDMGVPEDPATGSAALGYGVWLVASGLLPGDGESAYTLRQGLEIGRPSALDCTVRAEDGRAVRATVAGRVVPVGSGEICIPR